MQDQNTGTSQQSVNIQIPTVENIAARRSIIPFSFGLVLILFFFTFFEFQCEGRKIKSITGINLVTGKTIKERDPLFGREKEAGKIPPVFWAILTLGVSVVGLGTYLLKEKREALIGTAASIIGFISLVILQIDIKNKVNHDSQGQVEAVFQFPYWLALITLGVASYIGYLRIKKSYNFVSPVPSVNEASPENISPVQPAAAIQNPENFDAGKWLGRNKKMIYGIIGVAVVIFCVYYFFLKQDPLKDGKKTASLLCDCVEDRTEQKAASYRKFVAEFDSYKFSGRAEAQQKLDSLEEEITKSYQECFKSYQERLTKMKGRYVGDKEKTEKFEYAYSSRLMLCNESNKDNNNLYVQAISKINEYIGPVEKEQARQDSIAAVEAAYLQAKQQSINVAISLNTLNNSSIGKIIDGVWSGIVEQEGNEPYLVEFVSQKGMNDFRFLIAKFDCRGYGTIESISDRSIDLREHNEPKKSGCMDGALVRLIMINDNRIELLVLPNSVDVVAKAIIERE